MKHHNGWNALPRGQTVAAQVPYTKRKQEWIIASVMSYHEESGTYVVKDEFPENKKLKSWHVPPHKVIRFPRQNEAWEQIEAGDKVLSLWYMPDTEEWSSMFYEATIVNIQEGGKVGLRFSGDNEVYDIDSTKLVKPKRQANQKGQKRPLSQATGSRGTSSANAQHNHRNVASDRPRHRTARENGTQINGHYGNGYSDDEGQHETGLSDGDDYEDADADIRPPPSKKAKIKPEKRALSRNNANANAHSASAHHSTSSPNQSPTYTSHPRASTAASSHHSTNSINNNNGTNNGDTAASTALASHQHHHVITKHNYTSCAATNLQTYKYPDFCGVLGKKIKRMNAILNERTDKP